MNESENPREALEHTEIINKYFPNLPNATAAAALTKFSTGYIHNSTDDLLQALHANQRYSNASQQQGIMPTQTYAEQKYYYQLWKMRFQKDSISSVH